MSKFIRMSENQAKECLADFEKMLQKIKIADGKINFTKTFSCKQYKTTVYFTAEAYLKMLYLLNNFDVEVAWHGVAERADNDYIISDIIVYPQEVASTTVEMDPEEYSLWLMENAEDERFEKIRMQGHSHVNMSTSPSSVDLTHQQEILDMLGDDDFYIFMIWNKSLRKNVWVYDMKRNILFENADIEVDVLTDKESLEDFLTDAKKLVKKKTYSYGGNKKSDYPETYNPNNPYYDRYCGKNNKKDTKETNKKLKDEKKKSHIDNTWKTK